MISISSVYFNWFFLVCCNDNLFFCFLLSAIKRENNSRKCQCLFHSCQMNPDYRIYQIDCCMQIQNSIACKCTCAIQKSRFKWKTFYLLWLIFIIMSSFQQHEHLFIHDCCLFIESSDIQGFTMQRSGLTLIFGN